MNNWKIFTLKKITLSVLLPILLPIILPGCITIEVPAGSKSISEPQTPNSVERMENLGYNFTYYSVDDPYWEAENSIDGWTFRYWENGAFGMSGQFDKNYDAQTEASIDFFKSLDVSPDQADFTVRLTVEALANTDGEASACEMGLCCSAQVVNSQNIYIWYCEFE